MTLLPSLWTSKEIEIVTGGKATGSFTVSGISIDTRTLEKGDLFVPLKDIRDGHDFIDMALEKGAGGVLSERLDDSPAIVVENTLDALRAMGKARVCSSGTAIRIAVTGSVGKTSVKEALAHMFSKAGKPHKSLKSYNNHWGVPLTMARMPRDAKYAIFEMGMNHAGELSDLSKLVQPEIALITTVAGAHLEHFSSVEAIADAKAEIIDGLTSGGTLILDGNNPHTPYIKAKVKSGQSVVTFGNADDCDVQIIAHKCHAFGSNIRLRIDSQQYDVTLSIPGEHWVRNAAACMAIAYVDGSMSLRNAARALRGIQLEAGRGKVHSLVIDGKSVTLVDESYNANPESMRAAIASLGLNGGPNRGRKIAVLGDMLELGENENALHGGLLENLQTANIDQVITCGERMKNLNAVLPKSMNAGWVSSHGECFASLSNQLKDGDTVMVKGSNASGMGKLVAALISHNNNKEFAHAI